MNDKKIKIKKATLQWHQRNLSRKGTILVFKGTNLHFDCKTKKKKKKQKKKA